MDHDEPRLFPAYFVKKPTGVILGFAVDSDYFDVSGSCFVIDPNIRRVASMVQTGITRLIRGRDRSRVSCGGWPPLTLYALSCV